MPPNDSKFWPALTLIVVGIIFTVNANVLYKNGCSNADFINLVTILIGAGAVSATQIFGKKST